MNGFFQLARLTLTNTPAAWQQLRMRLPHPAERWSLLFATVILSALVAWLLSQILGPATVPPGADPALQVMATIRQLLEERPLTFTSLQLSWLLFAVVAVTLVGRLFGGRARLDEVVLATGWMKAIMLVVQVLQVIVVNLSMGLAAMLSVAESALYLFLAVRLTQTVHGFSSMFKVAVMMILAFFVILFALALLLVLLGLAPAGVPTHAL